MVFIHDSQAKHSGQESLETVKLGQVWGSGILKMRELGISFSLKKNCSESY